jgi:hypothetical protein
MEWIASNSESIGLGHREKRADSREKKKEKHYIVLEAQKISLAANRCNAVRWEFLDLLLSHKVA